MEKIVVILILCLLSCDIPNPNDPEVQKLNEMDSNPDSKLSQIELRYIDSLENATGFKVEISRTDKYVNYNVYLTNDTFFVDSSNYEYLVSLRKKIVSELCCIVISDSLKYELTTISCWYKLPDYKNGKYYKSGLSKKQFNPIASYSVESLLENCGKNK